MDLEAVRTFVAVVDNSRFQEAADALSITQQGIIMKRQGAKIELWDNLASLFRKRPSPAE